MNIEERFAAHPADVRNYSHERLNADFIIPSPMGVDCINLVYSHYDRYLAGGVIPMAKEITLETFDQLKAENFLDRRELGVVNIGGAGVVSVEGTTYELTKLDALYIGQKAGKVTFKSLDADQPAKFYINSAPAHHAYPVQLVRQESAIQVELGSAAEANKRTLNKLLVKETIDTCQLQMGVTILHEGSIWNTMPPHTHTRRMEVYFYFDLPGEQAVSHFMGEPEATRKLWLTNEQAVISPPWSIHCGAGTSNYSFIWGMAGENLDYSDMDVCAPVSLR